MEAIERSLSPPARRDTYEVCALLGRAEREVRRALSAALASTSLTVDEFFLLAACDTHRPGQTELTVSSGLSAAQTSTLLDGLRRQRLLEPQRDPSDRRRQAWRLTSEGRERLAAGWQALDPVLGVLLEQLPEGEWQRLAEALRMLSATTTVERRRSA